jgi:hypothetical protein
MKFLFIYFLTWSAATIASQQQQEKQQLGNKKITLEELSENEQ